MIFEKEVTLNTNIKYGDTTTGEEGNTDTIVLYAPTKKQIPLAAKLQQKFTAIAVAATKNSNKNTENTTTTSDSKNTLNAQDVVNIFMGQTMFDITEIMNIFEKILLHDGAKLDGKISLKDASLSQISYKDLLNLLGEYVANFTSPTM